MPLINYITRIHFADDVLEEALAAEFVSLQVKRPLVVTDEGLVRSGLVGRLRDALGDEVDPTFFTGTPQNPTEAAARQALEVYRLNECDGLVGFGGGSSIDLAKAVGLLATHGGQLKYFAAVEGGFSRIKKPLPPLIAIPTTAGTGSEVGRTAVIGLNDGRKVGIISPLLVPSAAICDPTLTLDLPPQLTAGCGMDAICHCIETFLVTSYNPPADGIAIDGLKRGAANIERALANPHNLDARREMMAAALNGALAFQKGLGGVHAISHALGGLPGHSLHHGTLNSVVLPHVLTFNAPAVGGRFVNLKEAMQLEIGSDLPEALYRLRERLGLPSRLGEMGIDLETIEKAAPLAELDHTNGTNPRRAATKDYRDMMIAAL